MIDTLRTTGAVRQFLPDPVPDDTVYRLLDTARFAPSGGNRQGWRVILVKDRRLRTVLRDLYLRGWYEYLAQASVGLVPFSPLNDRDAETRALAGVATIEAQAAAGPGGFAEHLDNVPVLLVLLADLRRVAAVDKDRPRYTFMGGASIYPFAWNLLLAAQAEGLGGVLTTVAVRREEQVAAVFGVPDEFALAGVVAMGWPAHQPRRLTRAPVEDFATVDRYDGPQLRPMA